MVYVVLIFALMALIDLRPLIKKGPKRDRNIVIGIYAAVLVICALLAGGIEIPSPLMAAGDLVKGLGLSYPPLK